MPSGDHAFYLAALTPQDGHFAPRVIESQKDLEVPVFNASIDDSIPFDHWLARTEIGVPKESDDANAVLDQDNRVISAAGLVSSLDHIDRRIDRRKTIRRDAKGDCRLIPHLQQTLRQISLSGGQDARLVPVSQHLFQFVSRHR